MLSFVPIQAAHRTPSPKWYLFNSEMCWIMVYCQSFWAESIKASRVPGSTRVAVSLGWDEADRRNECRCGLSRAAGKDNEPTAYSATPEESNLSSPLVYWWKKTDQLNEQTVMRKKDIRLLIILTRWRARIIIVVLESQHYNNTKPHELNQI